MELLETATYTKAGEGRKAPGRYAKKPVAKVGTGHLSVGVVRRARVNLAVQGPIRAGRGVGQRQQGRLLQRAQANHI